MMKALSISLLLVTAITTAVFAREEIAGPVEATILRIVDGDTLLVEARPWPQQRMEVYVRIRGIDAPEIKSGCPDTRLAGADARNALEELTTASRKIQLVHISGDKYFGRIVADVILSDGKNVADGLLVAGLVRVYSGGRKPKENCDG